MNKKSLSERDICSKFITPALIQAGWNLQSQILEEVTFTDGKIYVKGKLTSRGKGKRADYILYHQSEIPVAIIEAKDNKHSVRAGLQQALDYAKILDIPCVFSSNGDGFIFHDRTSIDENMETEIPIDGFPSPEALWVKYKKYKGIVTPLAEKIISQPYFVDSSGRKLRYYQQIAVNRTVEAVANGQNRVLLVMATGTGKTYTAFHIIHRLWKSGTKKRILFLADRNALIQQTKRGDFKPFKDKMTIVKNRKIDKSYEIYLALYQGLSGSDEAANAYKQFSPDFFDLIVIDECHRGSAKDDSSWREILTYFKNAMHIGLTATPKETTETSNSEYFGKPLYTYSLKQGISDGFLAPYRVIKITLNVDVDGWRPEEGKTDKQGVLVEDRLFNIRDYDRKLVIDERTNMVAQKLTEFLKASDRYSKTIVFCADIDHAERMRTALANKNADLVSKNYKYVMQITGDNPEGKLELDNFTDKDQTYPVIATTSELMTTGIDAPTCRVIVLDANINSMTKFKQIIGRGTRINEYYQKLYFTILDFRNATALFSDPAFDGDPIAIKEATQDSDVNALIDEDEDLPDVLTDEETGETIEFQKPVICHPEIDRPLTLAEERRQKIYVNGVNVSVLLSREVDLNKDGRQITVSLKDHTREIVQSRFASLQDFLTTWTSAERKDAVIEELIDQGVLIDDLYDAVDREVDAFDLICHIAFDQPPLTRKERANNVKKRNYFARYSDAARKVLEALLDKYADEGIENIESMNVLKLKPLCDIGSTIEIVNGIFGGKEKYTLALTELENELYKVA